MADAAVFLRDRGVVRVSGPEAAAFLQGLVTNDVEKLPRGGVRFAALLSPQGKILFDFLIFRPSDDEFLLDVAAEKVAELVKRLGFYKLRAKVEVSDGSADYAVVVDPEGEPADPRNAALGGRRIAPGGQAPAGDEAAHAGYESRRIGLCVPQGGRDFAYGDAFPHDVNMDLLNGVDFTKGCYVGQEVVSRMKHRGEVRKRVLRVALEGAPPAPGSAILDGALPVGVLGTSAGKQALALVRVDRVEDADASGRTLTVEGKGLSVLR